MAWIIFLTTILSSCVSITHRSQPWGDPVELGLDPESLSGAFIQVTCAQSKARKNKTPNLVETKVAACADIKRSLTMANAELFGADMNESDNQDLDEEKIKEKRKRFQEHGFELVYVEKDSHSDYGGGTLPLFIFSFTLFPLVVDSDASAQILFRDPDGTIRGSYPIYLSSVDFYGIGALPILLFQKTAQWSIPQRKFYDEETKRNLLKYIRNLTYTHYKRKLCGFTSCF
ncbi:MAG: hypothetical protein KA436_06985 [Oligoflexales bacterium]|nr:hypothetical protein [Oligoflexales bacterium]